LALGPGRLGIRGALPLADGYQGGQARAEAQAKAKAKAEAEKQAAAAKRAQELLREHLSTKQRKSLDKHGWFLVEGGRSKKTYRIQAGQCAGNIYELNEAEQEVARYCVHASYEIPLGDQLLAQTISLRYDEDHIIGKANKTEIWTEQQRQAA
jgi:hypothetical protein